MMLGCERTELSCLLEYFSSCSLETNKRISAALMSLCIALIRMVDAPATRRCNLAIELFSKYVCHSCDSELYVIHLLDILGARESHLQRLKQRIGSTYGEVSFSILSGQDPVLMSKYLISVQRRSRHRSNWKCFVFHSDRNMQSIPWVADRNYNSNNQYTSIFIINFMWWWEYKLRNRSLHHWKTLEQPWGLWESVKCEIEKPIPLSTVQTTADVSASAIRNTFTYSLFPKMDNTGLCPGLHTLYRLLEVRASHGTAGSICHIPSGKKYWVVFLMWPYMLGNSSLIFKHLRFVVS